MMVVAQEWLERSDWRKRSPGFGALRTSEVDSPQVPIHTSRWEAVLFDFASVDSGLVIADELWARWRTLPRYSRILEPVEGGLRYAAIDWDAMPVAVGTRPDVHARVAGYGLEIAYTLDFIVKMVGLRDAAWFVCPIAKLTLNGEIKIAFATSGQSIQASRLPPEIIEGGPCDERALVYSVGQVLLELIGDELDDLDDPIGTVLRRCTAPSPAARFDTLGNLNIALRKAGAPKRVHPGLREKDKRWVLLDHALGLVNAGLPVDAMRVLTLATRQWGMDEDLQTLMALVSTRVVDEESPVAATPMIPPTRLELVDRALKKREPALALTLADAWLATEPDEPRAHHVRGKALLSLGRLDDARAAFDRACTLRPQMLEAMLLRGEVDRAIVKLRGMVGTARPMQLGLSEHLSELRDVLISGRNIDAISMLQGEAYAADLTAPLLLGELLATELRHGEALSVYTKLVGHEAALGMARAYLALDRAAEALTAIDALIAARPDVDEALELRSRVLLALDRSDDAEAQHTEYIHAITKRSDRRVHTR